MGPLAKHWAGQTPGNVKFHSLGGGYN